MRFLPSLALTVCVALTAFETALAHAVLPEPPRVDGSTIEIALPPDLPPAVDIASWRVTAADSHPATGTLVFSVAMEIPHGFAPETSGQANRFWQALNVVLRSLVTAAVLLAAGTELFSLLVARPDPALSLTPPPRNAQPPGELQVHTHSQGIAATAAGSRINAVIEASPGTVGRNRIVVEIVDAQGLSVAPKALILELVPRDDTAAALRHRLRDHHQLRRGGSYRRRQHAGGGEGRVPNDDPR